MQLNEADGAIQVVNNTPELITGLNVRASIYNLNGTLDAETSYPVAQVAGSTTIKAAQIDVSTHISEVYFIKLDLLDGQGKLISTNFYWQNVAQDDFTQLAKLQTATLEVSVIPRIVGDNTLLDVTIHNPAQAVALMTHLPIAPAGVGQKSAPGILFG